MVDTSFILAFNLLDEKFVQFEQGDFSLIWNTYMWKLKTFCG